MIDPTISEVTKLRSLKKFFVDSFAGLFPVYFDIIEKPPKVSGVAVESWVSVKVSPSSLGNLASTSVFVYLFVVEDTDGMKLAEMQDKVTELLLDLDQTDGRKRIPIYDANWNILFYSVAVLKNAMDTIVLEDGIKTRLLPFLLYWGSR